METKTIGDRLRKARMAKNFTLTDMHVLTGLSTGNLSELENNKFLPSAKALISFKRALGVSIDWLLTGEGHNTIADVQYFTQENPDNTGNCPVKEFCNPSYCLKEDEKKLVDSFRKIDEAKRRDILGFIDICLISSKTQ